MNDRDPDAPEIGWYRDGAGPDDAAPEGLAERPAPGLDDMSAAAGDRIRQFMAESTVRGGASPADVADLYTSHEVMADEAATAYLDRRFVHGEVPDDWRRFQDELSAAHFSAQPETSGDALLARVERRAEQRRQERSIFDDPDDDELDDEERSGRLEERDPSLADLHDEARRAIERYVLADVLCYGVAPFKVMELREQLAASGDERALQYLDIPYDVGDRPLDWDSLRDRALRLRARLEGRGIDPAEVFVNAEGAHPDLDARGLLALLEDRAERR